MFQYNLHIITFGYKAENREMLTEIEFMSDTLK